MSFKTRPTLPAMIPLLLLFLFARSMAFVHHRGGGGGVAVVPRIVPGGMVGSGSYNTPTRNRRGSGAAVVVAVPLHEKTTSRTSSTDIDVNKDLVNGTGGLIRAGDAKSQLFSAFTALSLPDQYDAVLTGLCAKILDDTALSNQQAIARLQDPIQLVQEMNEKRITGSPRSIMALVDAAVKTHDAKVMAQVMSLCLRNGGVRQYGAQQTDIMLLPSSRTTPVMCPDGTMKTRAERLANVADVPLDNRVAEVSAALAFGAVVGACGLTDLFSMSDITPYTNLLLSSMMIVGVLDNFYDLLKSGTQLVIRQVAKDSDNRFDLPEKDSLPLGLGSGQLTGTVVRGLARVLTVDAERESKCEAAALFAAYALGLPCFAFRPNAYESSVLVVESIEDNNQVDPLLSSSGIMRVLIWLMAPAAMESAKHTQLIMSDPREADGFLQRLEEYAQRVPDLGQELWWKDDTQERADLLKWAYTEADLLLRSNTRTVSEIGNRLTGGAATIGDCIAVAENW